MLMIDSLRNENRASVEHHECVFRLLSLISPSMPYIFEYMWWLIVDTILGKLLELFQIYCLRWCISI